MSEPKDIDEHKADPDHSWLVDLLYGELEGEDAAEAEDRLRANSALAAEFDEFQDLRRMMRDLPDEEPPASVTAKLLHAAAMEAPAAAKQRAHSDEERGLWAWLKSLFQPIMMYPGLAAATSLVLVATVAGAVYFTRDDGRLGPSGLESEAAKAESPASAIAPATPAEQREMALGQDSDRKPGGLGADAPAGASAADLDQMGDTGARGRAAAADPRPSEAEAERLGKDRVVRAKRRRAADSKAGAAGLGSYGPGRTVTLDERKKADRNEPSAPPPAPDPAQQAAPQKPVAKGKKAANKNRPARRPAPATTGVASDSLDIGLEEAEAGDSAGAPESAPQRDAPRADAPDDDADEEDGDGGAAARAERTRKLYREALAAAKKGDCAAVGAKAREIQFLDAGFYKKRVVGNKALAACLTAKRKK